MEIYQLLMQSYTSKIGHYYTEPQIVTICNITDQEVAGGNPDGGGEGGRDRRSRRIARGSWWSSGGFLRRTMRRRPLLFGWWTDDGDRYDGIIDDDDGGGGVQKLGWTTRRPGRDLVEDVTTRNLIVMSFTMTYETRYGIDISNYPFLFSDYIVSNLENVTIDMQERFLPVVAAMEVIVYNPDPTIAPSPTPTTSSPTTSRPIESSAGLISDPPSFVVGLAAGLTFAGAVVLFAIGYLYVQRRKRRDNEGTGGVTSNVVDRAVPSWEEEEGTEIDDATYDVDGDVRRTSSEDDEELRAISNVSNDWVRHRGVDDVHFSSPLSNPSMVSEGGGSLSSNGDDYQERMGGRGGVRVDALQDEFDQYKNEDLEHMRNGVEESVYGAEGMMSLAMTRALMDDEDADMHPSWGEAEDPESIEANALCETNDWLRKNELTTLDERLVSQLFIPPSR
jgi:hypothetical protein